MTQIRNRGFQRSVRTADHQREQQDQRVDAADMSSPAPNGSGSSSSRAKAAAEAKKYSPETQFNPSMTPDQLSRHFLEFMNNNPTTYHAVGSLGKFLESRGFVYLSERESWEDKISTSSKFYTTRNGSSLLAFVVGADWKPGCGVALIGSHVDSLAARVKPISVKEPVDGYELLGAAPYSGAFNSTWWDRDLGLGGRLIARCGDQNKKKIVSKLVKIPYPVARIPTLAPHFGKVAEPPFNTETQMTPVVGLTDATEAMDPPTDDEKSSPLYGKHSLRLLRAISEHSGIAVKDMIQFDMELFDTQPGQLGGLAKELLFCPRLDDKLCSYAAIAGLAESLDTAESNSSISMVALFDDEEIGSNLRQGALGTLVESAIDRLIGMYDVSAFSEVSAEESKRLTLANSFFVSADVIHAVNPNFDNVYLEHHKPKLNTGITISHDPNGHMTTDAVSAAFVEEIARRSDTPLQHFQIRNDSRSGGTIGPHLSTRTGMRAVDMGIVQLSMHSIRATTGSKDVWLGVKFFKAFFEHWEEVDAEFKLGDL